ncbi:MFS transporter [Streptomyces sp. NBC_00568]|uniref:MFS transporter n=1 Tax=Streptomyces sp. NBC_00568 TaxID=2975779 RepID=UPI00225A70CC|nr:MFS transporter [Streptomyces sp. NBC_00568]MCX4993668.1 MFS transporter [Streptomyces sp. NBC_00568]
MRAKETVPPDVTSLRRRILPTWANRNFQLLAASAVITGFGSSGAMTAAAFAVLEAGGTGTDVGLVAAARTAPLVAFLLIGGAVADRLPRHRVMVAANLLNACSQAVFAVLVLSGQAQVWQMAVLSALGGTAQAFFSPASEGMILNSVQQAHASQAFAIYRLGVNGGNVAGAALGGALIAFSSPGVVLALDAGSFALAALLRMFLRVGSLLPSERSSGMWRDLRDGWREFVSRRWLWSIVVQFSVINAVTSAALAVYGPQVAASDLGGAGSWGVALAAFGLGNVLGGFLMVRWRPRRILLSGVLCVSAYALPAAALAVPVPVPLLVVAMLVAGCSSEVFGVLWMIALHQEIPQDMLSRISAYDWLGSVAIVPLGMAAAAPAAETLGMSGALWGCAVLTVLLTGALLLAPEIRRLERAENNPPTPAPPDQPAREVTSDGTVSST